MKKLVMMMALIASMFFTTGCDLDNEIEGELLSVLYPLLAKSARTKP